MIPRQSKILFKVNALVLLLTMALFVGFESFAHDGVTLRLEPSKLSEIPVSLSWKTDTQKTVEQNAYQIILFTKKQDHATDHIVWDSGKVNSPQNLFVPYLGPSLNGGSVYYFKVKVWDISGDSSSWSAPQTYVAPLKYPDDWSADWITYDYTPARALPIFRKSFQIDEYKDLDFVRFHIAAPGFYEAYLNGKKIGKNVLDPAQTNYDDYMFYSEYDISIEQLKTKNVLGVMLGNGWYNQNLIWGGNLGYGQPTFLAQMDLYFKNGRKETIRSDKSWLWKDGPITFSNIYAGETYNATKEATDWFSNEIEDAQWSAANIAKSSPKRVERQFAELIQVMDSLVTKRILPTDNGTYIFDFGQNFAGWVRLKIRGEKGQEITIQFAEELAKDGQLDFRSTGVFATKVKQTENYVCKGEGIEIWEPRFTYHGFRYAEVSGLKHAPDKELLTGMVVYSSMENTGYFKTSEPGINKLHELSVWTLKSNLQGIPTDCPQREKCGWTGDAHAIGKTLIYNYDAHKFLTKYNFDMRSSGKKKIKDMFFGKGFYDRTIKNKPIGITTMIVPGKRTSGIASPDWGTAVVQLPWYLYLYYGDEGILKEFYDDMKTWVTYVHSQNEDGIIPNGLGDWFPPGGLESMDCPVPLSSTAFHILDISHLKKAAKVLGYSQDEKEYAAMEARLIEKFNATFLDRKKQTYGSQTANSMALEMGLVPDDYKKGVAQAIISYSVEDFNGFFNAGIFGLPRIFPALCENGFEEEAFKLLTKKGNHSFENIWTQYDATTLWEILPTTNIEPEDLHMMMERSHNHPMQGGYDAWFYSGIGGINPSEAEPGFKKIIFKPYLTRQIGTADTFYKSTLGLIKSKWQRNGDQFSWEIKIPDHAKGDVYVPNYNKKIKITINGAPLNIKDYNHDFTFIGELPAGTHIIEMKAI